MLENFHLTSSRIPRTCAFRNCMQKHEDEFVLSLKEFRSLFCVFRRSLSRKTVCADSGLNGNEKKKFMGNAQLGGLGQRRNGNVEKLTVPTKPKKEREMIINLEASAIHEIPNGNIFKRLPSGLWKVMFKGDDCGIWPASKGMDYLGFLLGHPGEDSRISCAELYHKFNPVYVPDSDVSQLDQALSEVVGLSLRDGKTSAGEIVDPRYRRDLETRRQELELQLQAARKNGDTAAALDIIDEMERIRKVTFSQTKRGCGSKEFSDPLHTAYTRVANALGRCYEKFEFGGKREFARHLKNSIKPRNGFAYLPESPIAWET